MARVQRLHPLDRYQLLSGGLDEQEVSHRLAERTRQQAKLDNQMAQAYAIARRDGDFVEPSAWLKVVGYVAALVMAGGVLLIGAMVLG